MMRWTSSARPKWAFLTFVILSVLILGFFQNCGKAGFDSGTGASDLASLNNTDSRLSSAPFPVDASVNQIAYMSCPMAGANTRRQSVDLDNPFFNVRVGGYDNTGFATTFGAAGLSETEKNNRLRHGIGISEEFVDFIRGSYKRDDSDILRKKVMEHPKTQNMIPTLALLWSERSKTDPLSYIWTTKQGEGYTRIMDSLTNPPMANYLATSPLLPGGGTQKKNFFAGLEASQSPMVGSLSWGQSEKDRDDLARNLNGSLILAMGFMDGYTDDVTQMASPDSDPYKTIYGKGYRLSLGSQSADGLIANKSVLLRDVDEFAMDKKPIVNLSDRENAQWACFSLRIVRKIDTTNPCTKLPYSSPGIYDSYSCTANGSPTGTVIHGVRAACPVQKVGNSDGSTAGSLNQIVTENGITYQKNMLRLQMARRMLPAEYWQINTDPNYMCAVPTDAATNISTCYASGDQDASKYIQYNLNDQNKGGCGGTAGANECPAYVSICYRKY